MEGILTAIVGFIFVCMVLPHIVKNRPQFTMAIMSVLLLMLLRIVAYLGVSHPGFVGFITFVCMLLEMLAFLLLVLSAGGLSPSQLAGDMARAYEVMRRGETEKTVIIPIQGQMPRPPHAANRNVDDEEEGRTVYTIDDPIVPKPAPPQPPAAAKDKDSGSIPLE